jgi:serine/threonine protein kinase
MEEVANAPQVYYNVGSPKYMAPEAYRQNKYSQKSDIWALGVILYEMVVGKTCDEGHTMESYLQMVASKGIPLPSHLSPFVKQLLAAMLCESSHNRFTCLQVLRLLKQYQSGVQ